MTDDSDPTTIPDAQNEHSLPTNVREGLRDATIALATADPDRDNTGTDSSSISPDSDATDLAPVGARLAGADVVGLGEATHGTREFFELKHRIVRHLVVDHGARAVALESNLPETMALHDYVVRGEGDPREALASVDAGCWEVESVRSMVEWLRAFNADRPLDDRVAVYGFAGHATHGAVERLRDHFAAVDPAFLDDVAADLAVVDDGELSTEADLTGVDGVSEWIETAGRLVRTLREHLDERRGTHVAATSERVWARARQYVAVVEQVRTKTEALDAFEGGARAEYDAAQYLRRMRRHGLPGRTMAENVAWIRDRADGDTVVLWAHDAHLNRVSFTLPDAEEAAPSLGRCLAERHGEDYYAVGFSFARGAFRAVRERDDGGFEPGAVPIDGPVPGTVDAALDALGEPLAFVDFRAARDDERTADWLAEPRPQFRVGGTYDADTPADQLVEYVYADAFDGLCFVAETTGARPLDDVAEPDAVDDDVGEAEDASDDCGNS